jgi:cell division protein FtsB
MIDAKNIKSEELETSIETGEEVFRSKKEDKTQAINKLVETEAGTIEDTEEQVGKGKILTPFEISRTKYYNSGKRKNDAKVAVLNILKYLIPIFVSFLVGLLAILGAIWAYKLNNITEPIGGIKVEIQYIKENYNDIKDQMQKLRDKVDEIEKKSIK